MALYNIGTEDSPQWVEGYWEGGYGDEAPIFRRADATMQSGNAEDGYRMIADPRISGLSALDQRMRDLGYKELWGQYDPNGNRLAGGFLEGYWQDPATGKIYGTGQSPAQWYYGQTADPTTGGWYVGNDPEAVKQQALSYGAKARTSGGDFITNFMDSGGGVAALMALAGMGAATGFGGGVGGAVGGDAGLAGIYNTGAGGFGAPLSAYEAALPLSAGVDASMAGLTGQLTGMSGLTPLADAASAGLQNSFTSSLGGTQTPSFGNSIGASFNINDPSTWPNISTPNGTGYSGGQSQPDLLSQYLTPTQNTGGLPQSGSVVDLSNSANMVPGVGSTSTGGQSFLDQLMQSLSPSGQSGQSGQSGGLLGAAASALPSYLAYQYANNLQQPNIAAYTDLYNKAGDTSGILGMYDINTGLGRNQLNSSLTARGVSGSSFGDQALTNYNTQRDLGRGSLGYQGIGTQLNALTGGNNALLAQNKIKTDLLGRALGGAGSAISQSAPSGGSSLNLGSLFGGIGGLYSGLNSLFA